MTTMTVGRRAIAPAAPPSPRAPNRIARQITRRDYVSHSQLSLMRSCPRKFSFTYVEDAPRDFIPCSLIFGGAVHAALETFYRAHLEGVGPLSADELLQVYRAAWRENRQAAGENVPVKFNKDDDEEKVHALAQRTFEAFLASPLATPKGEVLGVEEELRMVLHPDLPDVVARVDLVTRSEHALFVTDFKTSRSRWTPQKAQEAGDQLVLYASATERMARTVGLPVKLAFAVLTKAKAPQIQIVPVATEPGRAAATTAAAVQTWQAIVAGNFYPNPSPMNCSTCPYRSRCPAVGGQV